MSVEDRKAVLQHFQDVHRRYYNPTRRCKVVSELRGVILEDEGEEKKKILAPGCAAFVREITASANGEETVFICETQARPNFNEPFSEAKSLPLGPAAFDWSQLSLPFKTQGLEMLQSMSRLREECSLTARAVCLLTRFLEYTLLFPEYNFVFLGSWANCSQLPLLLQKLPFVRAIFLRTPPCEKPDVATNTLHTWTFRSFAGAAVGAFRFGLISQRVCKLIENEITAQITALASDQSEKEEWIKEIRVETRQVPQNGLFKKQMEEYIEWLSRLACDQSSSAEEGFGNSYIEDLCKQRPKDSSSKLLSHRNHSIADAILDSIVQLPKDQQEKKRHIDMALRHWMSSDRLPEASCGVKKVPDTTSHSLPVSRELRLEQERGKDSKPSRKGGGNARSRAPALPLDDSSKEELVLKYDPVTFDEKFDAHILKYVFTRTKVVQLLRSSENIITLDFKLPIPQALTILSKNGILSAPVTKKGRVVGIIDVL